MVDPNKTSKLVLWNNFELSDSDVEFIYNRLLEHEVPIKTNTITRMIVENRIEKTKAELLKRQSEADLYLPEQTYSVGQPLSFPALDMKKGVVRAVRKGNNPEIDQFSVIEVEFEDGDIREFASELDDHVLNQPVLFDPDDPTLDLENVIKTYPVIAKQVHQALDRNENFASIAEMWFPKGLLIDINIGYLNLAEAVLDISGDQPVSTADILAQIGFKDDNQDLLEFSMNIAMQKDERFAEVGPSGEVLWYLKSMLPEEVKTPPIYLQCKVDLSEEEQVEGLLTMFEGVIADEYSNAAVDDPDAKELTFSLIYPHWRSGTLPLSESLRTFFPTAIESPIIRFQFIDGHTKKTFPGWVVRPYRYVYGLTEWYKKMDLIPGSTIHIKKGENEGEVIVRTEKKRPSREWLRFVQVDADNNISFSMQMGLIKATFNDRMAIGISDDAALEKLWQTNRFAKNFDKTIRHIAHELVKLNPQGHVHAQELYAATNLIMRCPPNTILKHLDQADWITHQGDLYYRLNESTKEEDSYA